MWESTAKRWGLLRIYVPPKYKNAWIGSKNHDGYYVAECPGNQRVVLDDG
ncbi:MAG: hypothetical protein UX91_C0005G0022 [Candidatus Amesbacteria bacterium GW2011_GWB1_47_19]|nr:MAG: hypothetical protein UW51_C0007G0022 [Candidatus Amesbacteria bacterium GW2011_GWA1_44_24]KKU31104.1 MAG: hypothetical protein UX46_C0007G0022 [Candidatus Amesbacteria bacterium GW2011_GWC1_46_24]KKU67225.1 MAG: hypothetical protein UX91_C0005G0022 [Candidatus Amesbacteria bacterium GW2011_GWB1_47_19]